MPSIFCFSVFKRDLSLSRSPIGLIVQEVSEILQHSDGLLDGLLEAVVEEFVDDSSAYQRDGFGAVDAGAGDYELGLE